MPPHTLLCDEVLLYFILRIEVTQNLNLNSNEFVFYKGFQILERDFFSLFCFGSKPR
jgi:hypothetical protein